MVHFLWRRWYVVQGPGAGLAGARESIAVRISAAG